MNIESEDTYQVWAYMKYTGEITEYDEAVSFVEDEIHNQMYENACRRRKYIGLGYICGHDDGGKLWMDTNLSRIFVDR